MIVCMKEMKQLLFLSQQFLEPMPQKVEINQLHNNYRNESSPTITLTSSASSIAENAGSSLTLTATISQVADEDVTVNLGTAGTSTNGTDYASLSSITVSAGQLTGTASFTPIDDDIREHTSGDTTGNDSSETAININ